MEIQAGHFVPQKDLLLSYEKDQSAIEPIAKTCVLDLAAIGFSGLSLAQTSAIKVSLLDMTSVGGQMMGTGGRGYGHGMMGRGGMWFGGFWMVIFTVLLILTVAALIKYLMK